MANQVIRIGTSINDRIIGIYLFIFIFFVGMYIEKKCLLMFNALIYQNPNVIKKLQDKNMPKRRALSTVTDQNRKMCNFNFHEHKVPHQADVLIRT